MTDETEKPVPVLFRASYEDTDESHPYGKQWVVTAVFPTLPGTNDPGSMTCYAHLGQHSSCSWDWYHTTRPAKPQEYAELHLELLRVGYKLRIVKRISPAMRAELRKALTS